MIRASKIRFGWLLSLWLLPGVLLPQEAPSPYQLLRTLPVETRFFATDKLQQVYLVTPGNEVIKYDPDGLERFRYSNNTIGKLAHIDATNPFNLLLYYPEFQTAITLDRTLNKLEEFNLWNLNVVDIKSIAMAIDNGFWLYDDVACTLKKIDQHGKVLRQSDNLCLLLGLAPAPVKLVARGNFIYANDPALGLLVFDLFGQYVRMLSIPGIVDFQVLGQRILYDREGQYFIYNLESFTETPLTLPESDAEPRQVRIQKDLLYVLKEGTVDIYKRL